MNLIDAIIPLTAGIFLVSFPRLLTPKNLSSGEAAKRKAKLCKIGWVLIAVAVLYFLLIFARP